MDMMKIQTKSRQLVTPPDSVAAAPFTPPPIDDDENWSCVSRVLEEIRARQRGRSSTQSPWAAYTLDPKGYEDLLCRIQNDELLNGFVEDKLRFDYFPSASRLVLRMPARLHEEFIAAVVTEIQVQLASIQGASARFASEIKSAGSTTIEFPDKAYGKHDPDGQFDHAQAQYPGVVLEISYSQKRKDLARLADDYILGSQGNIQAVVGLDIEYKGSKEATLSIWKPHLEENEDGVSELTARQSVINQVFRNKNGKPSTSLTGDLVLRLRDLATPALTTLEGPLRDPILISAATLCSFLERAEKRSLMVSERTGVITPLDPSVRCRRREVTPPEVLSRKDETKFQKDEDKANDQAMNDDLSYKASSPSETEST